MRFDIVVVGGGPAGMAAASKSSELGYRVALMESSERLGGVLSRSIHTGFGQHYFKENLTGVEFADRLARKIEGEHIETFLNSYLEKIETGRNKKMKLTTPEGIKEIETQVIIFTTGAREKNRFEMGILGDRVSGIYTVGEAQEMMDIYGILPGKRILIFGSGYGSLIIAKRFLLEGCELVGLAGIYPQRYSGVDEDIAQILRNFNIPFFSEHRVVEIKGRKRVEKALVENLRTGEREWIECDRVIIEGGLIPKVKKLKKIGAKMDRKTGGPIVDEYFQTTVPGVFAAGNCVVPDDLVDYAVEQGEIAAIGADMYIRGLLPENTREIIAGRNVEYFVPQRIVGNEPFFVYGKVKKYMGNAKILLNGRNMGEIPVARSSEIFRVQISANIEGGMVLDAEGNSQRTEPISKEHAIEYSAMTLITVIPCRNGDLPVVSVKSTKSLPVDVIMKAIKFLSRLEIDAPIEVGEVIVKNIFNTGVDIVATRRCNRKE